MQTTGSIVSALAICCLWQTAATQEIPPRAFAYVTYFECDAALEFRADEIVERNYAPHYDAAVEAGEILSWSWLSHFVGGEWRRVLLLTTSDIESLLASAGALGEAIQQSTPQSGRDFTEVCNKHVDYIWESAPDVGGTPPAAERGPAGFSTYYACDLNREADADELMRTAIGPVYDGHVATGGLSTWTWLKHNVGGQYRRLLSLTAADHATMLNTREAIEGEMREGRLARRFEQLNDICPQHENYMWDIQIENP